MGRSDDNAVNMERSVSVDLREPVGANLSIVLLARRGMLATLDLCLVDALCLVNRRTG
jgi:hypothetical protein